jgi:hypothetical protein
MNPYIDKQKQGHQGDFKANGFRYEDAEQFLQCDILGFCGCGMPEKNLRYMRDCLRHIATLRIVNEKEKTDWESAWKEWMEAGNKLMGNAEYFTRYVLDHRGFTEHGVGITSAWLTEQGEQLLADLDALYE